MNGRRGTRWVVLLAGALLAVGLAACGGDDDATDTATGAAPAGASSLDGVAWVLTSGVEVDDWQTVAPSATFADGTVSGHNGCNRFTGEYTVDGQELTFGQLAQTQMACGPPGDAVERAYSAALGTVAGWRVEDGELILVNDADAEVLRFAEASPVGDWSANSILQGDAVSTLAAGTEITATFGADGRLTGSAGCNTYGAGYTASGGTMTVEPPFSTRKSCPEPAGVMEQEAAYLAALPTATGYRISAGLLELVTAQGTLVATYARVTRP